MKTKDTIQDEALKVLLPLNRGGAGITTGGGKTLVGLRHANANYNEFVRYLVVAPKLSIFTEWKAQAQEFKLAHLTPHIKFTTYLSLTKEDLDYDVLYLDECHSLLDTHDEWLSKFKGKIIGLSGTPPKHANSEKGKMVAKYCPIVYTYETDEAVEDKILNDYEIIVHMLDMDTAKNVHVKMGNKEWYTSERATYEYWTGRVENANPGKEVQIMRVMRMKAMMGFKSKEVLTRSLLREITNKCIIFANTQEQSDMLYTHSYHSKNPSSKQNLDMFKSGEIIKLSCVLQLSEGVNIPKLKEGIILHAYGNERKTAQRIGRLLRLNPKEKATVRVLCFRDSQDEYWVKNALEDFDQGKIRYV